MCRIFGYGEDAFTLWTLKQKMSDIVESFKDKTDPSNCLIFYRPSFGRHSKKDSSVFGEFDAIIVSSEKVYLIESKWDNLGEFDNNEFTLKKEQKLRHKIFSWYLVHWKEKYSNKREAFKEEHQHVFHKKFKRKTIAPAGSLLARNLESILTKTTEHCKKLSENNIKNVMLFFYNKDKSTPPAKINRTFKLIPIDYSKQIKDNFIILE
jgi:hypothetical protein